MGLEVESLPTLFWCVFSKERSSRNLGAQTFKEYLAFLYQVLVALGGNFVTLLAEFGFVEHRYQSIWTTVNWHFP
jgi:hypothetical protein